MTFINPLILQSMTGSLIRGGWIANGTLRNDVNALKYGDHVIFDGRIGCGWLDPDFTLMMEGHVFSGPSSITFDKFTSSASLQVGTPDNLLHGYLQGIGFTEQTTPANSHQITNMRISDIVEHILKKHCNVVQQPTTPEGIVTTLDIDDSTFVDFRNVHESNDLWRRLLMVGGGDKLGELHNIYFTRDGTLRYKPSLIISPPASLGTLDSEIIRGRPRVIDRQERPKNLISQVDLHTVRAKKDSLETFDTLFPTNQTEGTPLSIKRGVWANSQARTDAMAEAIYNWNNRAFTLSLMVDIGLIFAEGVDIGTTVTVDYDGSLDDGGSGMTLDVSGDYSIYGINLNFAEGFQAGCTLTLEAQF